jgi:DNA-binding GntR family transcriptional regulator
MMGRENKKERKTENHVKKNIVYTGVKEKIISGEYPPGGSISEKDVIADFNVSRTPIREALSLLEQEGWIRPVPRKGYAVTDITFEEIKDLFQIRYELEPVFLNVAFNFFEREKLERLRERILSLIEAQDIGALAEVDREFHLYLIKSTYNRFAIKIMDSINDHINRTRYLTFRDRDETLNSAAEHIKIINAILDGDKQRALETLKAHIDRSQLFFIRHFNFKRQDL